MFKNGFDILETRKKYADTKIFSLVAISRLIKRYKRQRVFSQKRLKKATEVALALYSARALLGTLGRA